MKARSQIGRPRSRLWSLLGVGSLPIRARAEQGLPRLLITTQYKELVGDRGGQGQAIGGRGNSDGNPADGQAHSDAGRGQTLQEFLASACGVGSQK